MGESHYMPEGSTVNRSPGTWYSATQDELTDSERSSLLTLGGVGVWALADLVTIATGSFRDGDGRAISPAAVPSPPTNEHSD